jgi:outer membrane protein assembly factor BamB/tetratricopeptide (TPR) repeat protein
LALDNLLADLGGPKQQLTNSYPSAGWWERYALDWSILFENATVGTLSADRQRVYAIEDLPLPPHPSLVNDAQPGVWTFSTLNDAVYHNELKAFDLASGALAWTIGGGTGPRAGIGLNLAGTFFLGPPLPLGGRLYVIAETIGELSLLCLDPGSGDVLWSQPLVGATDKIQLDVGRRVRSAHLAYGEGVLVCPTNAGAIVAVDPVTRNLLWAHVYRDTGLTNPDLGGLSFGPGFLTMSWRTSAPVIADGKVVFSAADGDTLRCLNLRDGSLLWSINRLDDDRYLAGVFRDKVLLVGRSACRALHLATGKEVWQSSTGVPSGQGVAGGGLYYLPLHRGGVCVLDVETGRELTFIACKIGDAPGNLLFGDGALISQGVNRVVIYPTLESHRQRKGGVVSEDIKDPIRLVERGVSRLDQGDLPAAIADLRAALAKDAPAPMRTLARAKLYEALTRLFELDFTAAEPYLGEYRKLCHVPIPTAATPEEQARLQLESRRREVLLSALVARGREQQGRLVEALRAYADLQNDEGWEQRLLRLDQDPVERLPRVWAAGRVAAMIARANPVRRATLEKEIAGQWRRLHTTNDCDAIGRFVVLFGSCTTAGKEARLRLAELLLDDPVGSRWLAAEQHLIQLAGATDEPPLAAQALEDLARLMTRKGLLEDAVFYYRRLNRDYPKIPVRNGKTGADLFKELSSDQRFLPYVSEAGSVWDGRALVVSETQGTFPFKIHDAPLQPEGELLPTLRQINLVLDLHTSRLRVVDRLSGVERWSQPISLGRLRSALQLLAGMMSLRLRYQVHGHVAVIPLGPLVVALDLAEQRVLWQRELAGSTASVQLQWSLDGAPHLLDADGWSQKLGPSGPAEAPCLCVQTRQGLMALDPVRGHVLWTRADVLGQIEAFGESTRCYLVELRGDGSHGGTRALRTVDGAAVPVPEFVTPYSLPSRVSVLGRHLLLADRDDQERLTLRLYDVETGIDAWEQQYPAKSLVVQTEVPGLSGVVDPAGSVALFDIRTRQEVFRAALDPQHLERVEAVNVLRDRTHWFVAIKLPSDNMRNQGEVWPNVQGSLRTAPVNGMIYAFDTVTKQLAWYHDMPNQMVLLDQLEESPVLLFAAAINRTVNPAGQPTVCFATRSLDKRTGKLLWSKESLANNLMPFHSLLVDTQAGTVDLVSQNLRIRHAVK